MDQIHNLKYLEYYHNSPIGFFFVIFVLDYYQIPTLHLVLTLGEKKKTIIKTRQ